MGITFSLQVAGSAFGHDMAALLTICQRAEQLGFEEVRVADHPGTTHDPFALLTMIAASTSTIRVGTYVLNMGIRHPLDAAISALTLADLTDGRFTLGIGAGHTPAEWQMRGAARPSVGGRVERLIEVAEVIPALCRGESVTFGGEHVQLDDAVIENPTLPEHTAIPLLIGGSNRRIVERAARTADVVAITGLGTTKKDGHDHAVNWSPEATDATVRRIDDAHGVGRRPVIDALVQVVDANPDRRSTAASLAAEVDSLEPEHALDCPFVLLGSARSIARQVTEYEDRWGITSYCVRPPAIEHIVEVMEHLA